MRFQMLQFAFAADLLTDSTYMIDVRCVPTLSASLCLRCYIFISVGGQHLPVILDTGSSDFVCFYYCHYISSLIRLQWIVSTLCTSVDCQSVHQYNSSNSSSLTTPPSARSFSLSYLLGAVEGTVVTETVTLGPFEILGQVLGLALSSFRDVSNSFPYFSQRSPKEQ